MGQSQSLRAQLRGMSARELSVELEGPNRDLWAQCDAEGRTALHWACVEGLEHVVTALVRHDVCPLDSQDERGATPLMLAAYGGHAGIVAILVRAGASLAVVDHEHMTALHWACAQGHAEAVRSLLEGGAPIDPEDARGRTPLAIAQRLRPISRKTVLGVLQGRAESSQSQWAVLLGALVEAWAYVRVVHPYLAYRTDITWDDALTRLLDRWLALEHEPLEVLSSQLPAVVDELLGALADPNSYAIAEKEKETAPITAHTESTMKVSRTGVATVTWTPSMPVRALESSLAAATAMLTQNASSLVLDLRAPHQSEREAVDGVGDERDVDDEAVAVIRRLLVPKNATLIYPTWRYRVHECPLSVDFCVASHKVVTGEAESPPPVRVVFLVNSYTPRAILSLACAWQCERVLLVFQAPPSQVVRVGESRFILVHEPHVPTVVLPVGPLLARIRVAERVLHDGTLAFRPDLLITDDNALEAAEQLASKFLGSQRRPPIVGVAGRTTLPSPVDASLSQREAVCAVWSLTRMWPPKSGSPGLGALLDALHAPSTRDAMQGLLGDYLEDLGGFVPAITLARVGSDVLVSGVSGGDETARIGDRLILPGGAVHAPHTALLGPRGSRVEITIVRGDDAPVQITLPRTVARSSLRPLSEAVVLVGDTAVVDLGALPASQELVDAVWSQIRPQKTLILDLRCWSSPAADLVLAYLVSDPVITHRVECPYVTPWTALFALHCATVPPTKLARERWLLPRHPHQESYRGHVLALIDENTGPEGERAVLALRAAVSGVRVLGAATQGHAPVPVIMRHSIAYRTGAILALDGAPVHLQGVVPDTPVEPTHEDVAAQVDTVLQRALTLAFDSQRT